MDRKIDRYVWIDRYIIIVLAPHAPRTLMDWRRTRRTGRHAGRQIDGLMDEQTDTYIDG